MKKRGMVSVSSNQTIHFRRSVMKQFLSIITAATLLLALAALSHAWEVTIYNKCNNEVEMRAHGAFLFGLFTSTCKTKAQSGEKKTCQLPWGHSVTYIDGSVYKELSKGFFAFTDGPGMVGCNPAKDADFCSTNIYVEAINNKDCTLKFIKQY